MALNGRKSGGSDESGIRPDDSDFVNRTMQECDFIFRITSLGSVTRLVMSRCLC
jgi:hypothetical protein